MRYVRKKKLIVAAILSVGILTAALLLEKESIFEPAPKEAGLIQSLDDLDRDTDGDGLKDWEEELLNTDPRDIDTDGDGISDKNELGGAFASRNDDISYSYQPTPDSSQKEVNITESVAKEFFIQYMSTEEGGSLENKKEDIINSLIGTITAPRADTYTVGDLTIITNSDDTTLHTYGNKVIEVIAQYPDIDIVLAIESFQTAVTTNSGQELAELAYQAGLYTNMAQTMVKVSVPQEFAELHLELSNLLHHTAEALTDMSTLREDSLRAIAGFGSHKTNVTGYHIILQKMAQLFANHSIIFSDTDVGSIWMKL